MRAAIALHVAAALAIACGGDGEGDQGSSGESGGSTAMSVTATSSAATDSSSGSSASTSVDGSSESGAVCIDPAGTTDDACGACEACDAAHFCVPSACSGDVLGSADVPLVGPWATDGCLWVYDPMQHAAHIVIQRSCGGGALETAWDRDDVARIASFAVGPDAVYWIEVDPGDDTRVIRAESDGDPVVVFEEALLANAPIAVAADDARIVVLRGTPGGDVGLLQSPLDGSSWGIVGNCIDLPAHDPLPDVDPDPRLVLAGDTAIFAMRYAAGRTIVLCSLVGDDPVELATDGDGGPFDLAAGDPFLYYSAAGGVARVALTGGMAEPAVAPVLGRFALADGSLFGASAGDLVAVEIASGTVAVLVGTEQPDDALAVADGALAWLAARDASDLHELRTIAVP